MDQLPPDLARQEWIDKRVAETDNDAVRAEEVHVSSALASNNVNEIEAAFHRVFRRIYLAGLEDGR